MSKLVHRRSFMVTVLSLALAMPWLAAAQCGGGTYGGGKSSESSACRCGCSKCQDCKCATCKCGKCETCKCTPKAGGTAVKSGGASS